MALNVKTFTSFFCVFCPKNFFKTFFQKPIDKSFSVVYNVSINTAL